MIEKGVLLRPTLSTKRSQTKYNHLCRFNFKYKIITGQQINRWPDNTGRTRRTSYSSVFKPFLYMAHLTKKTNFADIIRKLSQLADPLGTIRGKI
jgi:hypothetical protein